MTSLIKSGDRFGKLTVIRRTRPNYVECQCACGSVIEAIIGKLTSGWKKSCGCLSKETGSRQAIALNEKRRQSMIGKKFGKLTVLAIANWQLRNGTRRYRYQVRCECGLEKTVDGDNLRSGETKSCGCLRRQKGRPGHNRLKFGEAASNRIYGAYTRAAKKRGFNFDITKEQFLLICQKPCAYCGSPPSNKVEYRHGFGHFIYSGLDRVNNSKGYTTNNVVPSCEPCNIAKNNRSLQEFVDWIDCLHGRKETIMAINHSI